MEEKKKADKEKADKEKMEENHRVFAAALRNKKSTFTFENSKGELVTIDEATGVKKDTRKTFS
jgi:hypothetical protein